MRDDAYTVPVFYVLFFDSDVYGVVGPVVCGYHCGASTLALLCRRQCGGAACPVWLARVSPFVVGVLFFGYVSFQVFEGPDSFGIGVGGSWPGGAGSVPRFLVAVGTLGAQSGLVAAEGVLPFPLAREVTLLQPVGLCSVFWFLLVHRLVLPGSCPWPVAVREGLLGPCEGLVLGGLYWSGFRAACLWRRLVRPREV